MSCRESSPESSATEAPPKAARISRAGTAEVAVAAGFIGLTLGCGAAQAEAVAVEAKAKAYVGASCAKFDLGAALKARAARPFVGFAVDLPLAIFPYKRGAVFVLEKDGARFAFSLLKPNSPGCRVADVAALPARDTAAAILACRVDGDPRPTLAGFAARKEGESAPLGFWTIEPKSGRLTRQPIDAPGLAAKLRCAEPEAGD